MADKIKSIARIKAYEKSDPFIILLPVRIFSSSPKLNFFINTPLPTATAAAGVDSFKIQLSMLSKAEFIFVTICGSPQAENTVLDRLSKNISENIVIKIV